MLERFNQTTRIIIAISLAVVIWIAGILVGQEQAVTILNPEASLQSLFNRSPQIKVSLMIDYGDGSVKVYPGVSLVYGQTVLKLLEKISKTDEALKLAYQIDQPTGELKSFSLNNHSGNNAVGKTWLTWVNNNLMAQDINQIKLKARDVVELKFINLKK